MYVIRRPKFPRRSRKFDVIKFKDTRGDSLPYRGWDWDDKMSSVSQDFTLRYHKSCLISATPGRMIKIYRGRRRDRDSNSARSRGPYYKNNAMTSTNGLSSSVNNLIIFLSISWVCHTRFNVVDLLTCNCHCGWNSTDFWPAGHYHTQFTHAHVPSHIQLSLVLSVRLRNGQMPNGGHHWWRPISFRLQEWECCLFGAGFRVGWRVQGRKASFILK